MTKSLINERGRGRACGYARRVGAVGEIGMADWREERANRAPLAGPGIGRGRGGRRRRQWRLAPAAPVKLGPGPVRGQGPCTQPPTPPAPAPADPNPPPPAPSPGLKAAGNTTAAGFISLVTTPIPNQTTHTPQHTHQGRAACCRMPRASAAPARCTATARVPCRGRSPLPGEEDRERRVGFKKLRL